MSESNTISSKMLIAMCAAAFVGMLSAVAITLAVVMPMMKVSAAPATTANVDPAYAAYVQGYMAANTSHSTTHAPAVGCGESPTASGAAAAVSYKSDGMMSPEKMHKSYKEWVKNSYTTNNNYHTSKKSYVSNVNSNNTIDSNNKQDNSTTTNVEIKDSFKGIGNDFDLDQTTKVNNHSFNNDSYNNTVKDSYNKSKTEVNTNIENDTTVINDSFNKKKTEVNVDVKNSGNSLGLFPPVLAAQQS